ncbi:germacrene-A synthase-like [Humulus lupulus]|uniref:germacrene-A synthase-like n=1 Tax=Humulus lupulus TaxID=3486 RepID=UPI002B40EADC|nr:germacrene-A synthase-like [Humulus lupulus]
MKKEVSHNKALLELAMLDFNLLQCLHKKELSEINKWWKEIDFVHKVPFVRDRIVELYLWILGVFHEPEYYFARNITTKVIAMASVADDIYDAYGTFEELVLLTESIDRSVSDIYYCGTYYKVLLNCYDEFEKQLGKEESYKVHYAKEANRFCLVKIMRLLHRLAVSISPEFIAQEVFLSVPDIDNTLRSLKVPQFCSAFNDFLDSYKKNRQRTLQFEQRVLAQLAQLRASSLVEYLAPRSSMQGESVPLVPSSAPPVVSQDPPLSHFLKVQEKRLKKKMRISAWFEQHRDQLPSMVESYMKTYGVSEQEACDELKKQAVNAWNEINKEFLKPIVVPYLILNLVLNFLRVMDLLYKDGDGYTHV